jgi:alpha-galactosidase/6-phospho-beta-glucosidase family protein
MAPKVALRTAGKRVALVPRWEQLQRERAKTNQREYSMDSGPNSPERDEASHKQQREKNAHEAKDQRRQEAEERHERRQIRQEEREEREQVRQEEQAGAPESTGSGRELPMSEMVRGPSFAGLRPSSWLSR